MMTPREFEAGRWPVMSYPVVRPSLCSGDIVTWAGDSLMSRTIRLFAPGGSHTSIVVRLPDMPDVWLVEALGAGVVLTRMSARISNYAGRILVHRLSLDGERQSCAWRTALRLAGAQTRYDFLSLLRQMTRRVGLNMARGFCSETAAFVLASCGVIEFPPKAPTPGELACLLPGPVQLAPYTRAVEGETP